MADKHLETTWKILFFTYGLVPIIAGLDKFTNYLVDWSTYLNPTVTLVIPLSAGTIMMIVGVIEIIAGALVFTKFKRFAGYLIAAWLVLIAINLLLTGYYDIAVRDLVMAIGAFTFARLTEYLKK